MKLSLRQNGDEYIISNVCYCVGTVNFGFGFKIWMASDDMSSRGLLRATSTKKNSVESGKMHPYD